MQSTLDAARPNALGVRLQAWLEVNSSTHQVRACAELQPVAIDRNSTTPTRNSVPMRILRLALYVDGQERTSHRGEALLVAHNDVVRCETFATTASFGVAHAYVWAETQNNKGEIQQLRAQSVDVDIARLMWR